MNILVIDGQGGRLGRKLIENIRKTCPDACITAVGTNSIATSNMMNSNCADQLATGENAVVVACRTAEVIVGPFGIVTADAMLNIYRGSGFRLRRDSGGRDEPYPGAVGEGGRKMSSLQVRRLTYAALYLAIAMVLPFVTGQIPEIGAALCPMHIPALLCGFMCGWPWGAAVGFVAPLLRSVLFGMPAMFPSAVAMAFELAVYGGTAGLLYSRLPFTF